MPNVWLEGVLFFPLGVKERNALVIFEALAKH